MSRELKFKYIWKDLEGEQETHSRAYTLTEIRNNALTVIIIDLMKSKCKFIKGDLQYTGLNDKYGVEYCEDDIVRVWYTDNLDKPEQSFIGVVEYSGGRYAVCNDEMEIAHPLGNRPLSHEILGNKHENPELLEGSKK